MSGAQPPAYRPDSAHTATSFSLQRSPQVWKFGVGEQLIATPLLPKFQTWGGSTPRMDDDMTLWAESGLWNRG